MAKHNYILTNMDIEKLCEESSVQQLQEIIKALDFEIESRRTDLKKVVGDKYKDILTASDVIIKMRTTSQAVVENLDQIICKCAEISSWKLKENEIYQKINSKKLDERCSLAQVLLLISLKTQIWLSLENDNCNLGAQLYLFGQHIYTGLKLLKDDVLLRLPLIKSFQCDMDIIRNRILEKAFQKFQSVTVSAEESSSFLVAVILLQNKDISQLLTDFLEFRKSALRLIIDDSYDTTRAQVIAIVRCLLSTILTVYEIFLADKNSRLLKKKLDGIVLDVSNYTISKVELPKSPLMKYLPEIVSNFRPKISKVYGVEYPDIHLQKLVNFWVQECVKLVHEGIKEQLQLLLSIKTLYFIREEILKDCLPENWENVCKEMDLPKDFSIWCYFFEKLITSRVEEIISKDIKGIIEDLKSDWMAISETDESVKMSLNVWEEDEHDQNSNEVTLSMKIKGYSLGIIKICNNFDTKIKEMYEVVNLYLYQSEEHRNSNQAIKNIVDQTKMEKYFKQQWENNLKRFVSLLQNSSTSKEASEHSNEELFKKLIFTARLLQAIVSICPHLNKSCIIDDSNNLWEEITDLFNQNSLLYFHFWVENASLKNKQLINSLLDVSSIYNMLEILPKWETIEIESNTEQSVVKSSIKVPSRPSIALEKVFRGLSDTFNVLLPSMLPKEVHLVYLEKNIVTILDVYEKLSAQDLNQIQSLQFLFDVKYVTTFVVPKENSTLHHKSQKIADSLRTKVDPFDLDLIYKHLQNNVKFSVIQTQVIFGCLLPSAAHLANIGTGEKREHEKEPTIIAFSVPSSNTWFPLLPVTAPAQRVLVSSTVQPKKQQKGATKTNKSEKNIAEEAGSMVRSGAAALFGAMANEWFS